MRRLKIVQCFFSFEIGGAQILALELMNEMCNNHDVSLIVINVWDQKLLDQLDKRIEVFLLNRKKGSINPIPILKLNFILFKLKPDVIHCHEPKAAKGIKSSPGKLLQTVHDVGIDTTFYHLYDILIAISDSVYKDVISRSQLPVKTIYNGIPINQFRQRIYYSLENGEPIKIVQVSRLLHEKKGQDILLKALHRIIHHYGFSNFSMDFIGSGDSMDHLVRLTNQLSLQNQVNFPGDKDRSWLYANLSKFHILVQPSRYEGFGLTILEGIAAGLPVLASRIDGPAEILSGMPAGFLFEKEDVESCAKELFHLFTLYNNNEVSGLMSTTVHFMREKYSINTCAREYLQAYNRLISKEPLDPVLN